MGRNKKVLLISLGLAISIVALLLTAALAIRLLVNHAGIKTTIVDKVDRATGGLLDYGRIEVDYFPLPHLAIQDVDLARPKVFTLHAGEIAIYPRMLALLRGRIRFKKLMVSTPDIRVILSGTGEKTPSEAPPGEFGAVFFPAVINQGIAAVFNALAAIDPETRMEIDQGRATFNFPDGSSLQIGAIRAIAENTGDGLSLDLRAVSDVVQALAVRATVNVARSQAKGNISLTGINPQLALSYVSLPAGIAVEGTRAEANLDFTISGPEKASCRFRVRMPTLDIKRGTHALALSTAALDGEVEYEKRRLKLRLGTASAQQPALRLSANATLTQEPESGALNAQLEAAADQLDVAVAGRVCQAIAGDLAPIRTAFDVARAGLLADPAFSAVFTYDQDEWHPKKMKATGQLSRGRVRIAAIGAEVENVAGDIVYADEQANFRNLSGRFEGATFEDLDLAMNWANRASLSIRSSSVDVQAAPFFNWLTGFEELSGARQHISAMRGRATVSALTISGPLTAPDEWDMTITASPQDLILSTPRTSFEIKLTGGELVYRPTGTQSSNMVIEFLDASFVVSHRLSGMADPQALNCRIDGSMGPGAIAWTTTIAPIPAHLQIKPPVALTDIDLNWSRPSGISLSGNLKTAGGVSLFVDVAHTSEELNLRKLHFSDGATEATISARKKNALMTMAFSGTVEKQSVDRLLKTNQILSGSIAGDFNARIHMDAPLTSTFEGRLEGSGLHIPVLTRIPLRVDRFSITGHGHRVDILPSEISLDDKRLRVDGTMALRDHTLDFDINVDSDPLHVEWIQSLWKAEAALRPGDQSRSAPSVVPSGTIHLKTESLTYGGLIWSPVAADIRIDAGNARITVNQARLCGISTTGGMDVTPEGIGFDISPTANGASLQRTYNCLWDKPLKADARYDLAGEVHLPHTQGDPVTSLEGQMKFSSQNGRIYYANTLMKIFSVLNITEVFTGGESDLTEKGYGYSEASATATIANGKLHLNEILLDGNALKITGQGSIDLKAATANIVLLAAPLKTVDRIVDNIPIIRYITGGTLITIPLRLQGKFDALSVTPLPPSAVGKGLLNIMQRTLKSPFKLVENVGEFVSKQGDSAPLSPEQKRARQQAH